MKTTFALTALSIFVSFATQAQAQYWGWGYGDYSSTPYEGAMRGEADFARSYGLFLESEAKAAQTWGSVQRIQDSNRYLELQAYREARMVKKADRDALIAETARRNAERLPKASPNKPEPQVLTAAGRIAWPEVLLADRYDGTRTRLNKLFKERAATAHMSPNRQLRRDIEETSNTMAAELQTEIRDLSTPEYLQAKRFVQALGSEARRPAFSAQVAQSK